MDRAIVLHHLRNPYNLTDNELRGVRLFAANELERLYAVETKTKDLLTSLQTFKNDFNKKE